MNDATGIDLDLDFDDTTLRGLRNYVRRVTRALGLRGECSYVHADDQSDDGASAYVALDGRLPRYPDRDVALLWDDRDGWAAAIETHSGEDLRLVAHLCDEVFPPPEVVADAVRDLFGHSGDETPPAPESFAVTG
jgi:hypothetical protein